MGREEAYWLGGGWLVDVVEEEVGREVVALVVSGVGISGAVDVTGYVAGACSSCLVWTEDVVFCVKRGCLRRSWRFCFV